MSNEVYTKEDLKPKLDLIADGIFDNGIFKNEGSPYVNKSKLLFHRDTFFRKYNFIGSIAYTYKFHVKKSIKKEIKEAEGPSNDFFLKEGYKHLELESGIDLFLHPKLQEVPNEESIRLLNIAINTIPCTPLKRIVCEKVKSGRDAYVQMGGDTIYLRGTSFKGLPIATVLHEMCHIRQYRKHGRQIAVSYIPEGDGGFFSLASKGRQVGFYFNEVTLYTLLPTEFHANCPVSNGLLEVNKVLFEQGIFIPNIYGIEFEELVLHKNLGEQERTDPLKMKDVNSIKKHPFVNIYGLEIFKTQLYLAYDYFKEVDEEFLNELVEVVMSTEKFVRETLEI